MIQNLIALHGELLSRLLISNLNAFWSLPQRVSWHFESFYTQNRGNCGKLPPVTGPEYARVIEALSIYGPIQLRLSGSKHYEI